MNDPLLQKSFQFFKPTVGVSSSRIPTLEFLSQLGLECAWLVPGSWQVVPGFLEKLGPLLH